jgi:hypothetical protein
LGFGSVLFWAALIFGIVVLVRYWKGSNPFAAGSRASAEELLA